MNLTEEFFFFFFPVFFVHCAFLVCFFEHFSSVFVCFVVFWQLVLFVCLFVCLFVFCSWVHFFCYFVFGVLMPSA